MGGSPSSPPVISRRYVENGHITTAVTAFSSEIGDADHCRDPVRGGAVEHSSRQGRGRKASVTSHRGSLSHGAASWLAGSLPLHPPHRPLRALIRRRRRFGLVPRRAHAFVVPGLPPRRGVVALHPAAFDYGLELLVFLERHLAPVGWNPVLRPHAAGHEDQQDLRAWVPPGGGVTPLIHDLVLVTFVLTVAFVADRVREARRRRQQREFVMALIEGSPAGIAQTAAGSGAQRATAAPAFPDWESW